MTPAQEAMLAALGFGDEADGYLQVEPLQQITQESCLPEPTSPVTLREIARPRS